VGCACSLAEYIINYKTLTITETERLENIRLGHCTWWCEDTHDLIFNHSTVLDGKSESSLCIKINSLWVRNARRSISFSY